MEEKQENFKPIIDCIKSFNEQFLFTGNKTVNTGGAGIGAWINYVILAGVLKDHLSVEENIQVEEKLNSSIADSEKLLNELLVSNPSLFKLAVAFWYNSSLNMAAFSALNDYCKKLLLEVRSSLPSQQEADSWVTEATLGIITEFPVDTTSGAADAILVNVIAAQFNWVEPYEEVSSEEASEMGYWGEENYLFSENSYPTTKIFLYKGKVFAEHVNSSRPDETKQKLEVTSIIGEENTSMSELYEAYSASYSEKTYFNKIEDFTAHRTDFVKFESVKSSSNLSSAVLPAWEVDYVFGINDYGFYSLYETFNRVFNENLVFDSFQVFKSAFNKKGFEAAAVTVTMIRATSMPVLKEHVQYTVSYVRPYITVTELCSPVKEKNVWNKIPLFTSVINKSVPVSDRDFE